MALTFVITDLGNDVQFHMTGDEVDTKYTLNKLSMRVKQTTNNVFVTNGESFERNHGYLIIELSYDKVTSPVYADNDALYDGLLGMASGVALGSSGSGGGGNNTWTTAGGDFTATPTVSTANITLTGLSWTPAAENIAGVVKYSSSGDKETLNTSNVVVSGGVITLGNEDDFVSGDTVSVTLIGPDKAYDQALDSSIVSVLNPNYANYTSVEHLIDEANLGIDGVHDGTAAQQTVFTDTGEAFSAANVAEGFLIHNVTDATSALINIGGAGNPTADDITSASMGSNWDTDTASIPEVKRFVIPAESFSTLKISYSITAGAANKCFLYLYETLDATADDTDDTAWFNRGVAFLTGKDGFVTDHIEAAATNTETDILEIDCSAALKYMVKIVAECTDGVQSNTFDILIKKAY